MDISNIYFKKTKVLKYLHKTELKLVDLEIKYYRTSCWCCRSTGTETTGFRSPQALDKEGEIVVLSYEGLRLNVRMII